MKRKQFKEEFRNLLVVRYGWSVKYAAKFDHVLLKQYHKQGKAPIEAYWTIFNKEPDLLKTSG